MTILDIISPGLAEELDLTRGIAEGEVVEFRHVRANIPDPFSTKQFSTPAAHILAGRDMIIDKHDKQNNREKMIMNITGFEPITEPGKPTVMNPIIGPLEFDSTGSIYCTYVDINKWLFAKLNNKNQSNPNRKANKAVVFKEIDETKELTLKNNIFDYRAMASGIIMEADEDEEKLAIMAMKIQKAFPHAYKFDIGDPAKIKGLLAQIAENNPIDFIKGVQEPKSYLRLIVDDAVLRRKIYFDDHSENLTWNFRKPIGSSPKAKSPLITKLQDKKNATKRLAEFLLTAEGNKHYLELKADFEENYSKPR